MAAINSLSRRGTRTSTSVDPRRKEIDIDEKIRILHPEATPIQTAALTGLIRVGKAPISHKVEVMQYDTADCNEFCSAVTLGTGNNTRFARLTLDQAQRPDLQQYMYYMPQEKFFIVETEQVVEVVMTPTAAISYQGNEFNFDNTTLTGNTTNRSMPGTVIVRNIVPEPIKSFTTSHLIYMGYTAYEGQDYGAQPSQRDVLYDYNFVELKEKTIAMTADQKEWIKTKGPNDWQFQLEQAIAEMKMEVESTIMWSERSTEGTQNAPIHHLRGFHQHLHTNVAFYDPENLEDFEMMFANFAYENGFRYNASDKRRKIGICGSRYLFNFNYAFKDFRRTTSLMLNQDVGFDIDTYKLPGGFELVLMRSEYLSQNTKLENWLYVMDPTQAEMRLVKNYTTHFYHLENQRMHSLAIEWQGTVAWHLEQTHALLRT